MENSVTDNQIKVIMTEFDTIKSQFNALHQELQDKYGITDTLSVSENKLIVGIYNYDTLLKAIRK